MFFLILRENIYEFLLRGASNEYPQYMFSRRIKKNIITVWLKKCFDWIYEFTTKRMLFAW